jgi:two-component system cell cycle response regulator
MAEAIESLQGRLREQATTDALTGLYNRRYVIEALQREIYGTQRHHRKVAVAIFDLDGLKGINDRFGHAAGDDALSKVAAVLGDAVRASEVAARFGGDEFVVLLPDSDGEALRSVMDRIRIGVEKLGSIPADENSQVRLTVSAGGALMQDGDTADSLFDRDDMAMYQAKRAGRNRVQVAA